MRRLLLCVALLAGVSIFAGCRPRGQPKRPGPAPAPPQILPQQTPPKAPLKTPPKVPAKAPPKVPLNTPSIPGNPANPPTYSI